MEARSGCPDKIRIQAEGLFQWLVHATRPDGSTMFGARGRDSASIGCLKGWAASVADRSLAAVIDRWFPGSLAGGSPLDAPPLPAYSDGDRVLAVLRPDWTAGGDWIAADHRASVGSTRIEVAGEGRPWFKGLWTSTDQLADKVGPARPTSWSTGAYADCLEWAFRSGPTRVTRTLVLLRYRKVALLAQQEDGPIPSAGFRIGLAEGVKAAPIADLRAWSLARSKSTARMIPLGLPALPRPTDEGSLTVDDDQVVLKHHAEGRRRWLPIVLTWGRNPVHWRGLTVTEKSRVCPPDVAFGARLSWGQGQEGLLIYRSLNPPTLRVVLGHQTRARFLIARFTPEGNVLPLLTLE